jgi:regulator of sigma E protease
MTPASNPAELESIPEHLREHAFQLRPVWQRFLVVLAGPVANFLLAIIIFAAFFMTLGAPRTNVIGEVMPKTAAAAAGLRAGDKILSVGGRETPGFDDIRSVVTLRANETVPILIERGGQRLSITVHLQSDTVTDPFGQRFKRGLLGVAPTTEVLQRLPVYEAVPEAGRYTILIVRSMVDGLGQIITGKRGTEDVGGPIKIAQIAGQQATLGALPFVQLLALFSINLGFINLLPVPMLDGGHLFFYAVEGVRRRPLSARALEWAFRGGLAVILALVLFTTVNDLGSLGLWDRLQRLIG